MDGSPYALPPLVAAAITGALFAYVGASALGPLRGRLQALLAALFVWCLFYAAEILLPGLPLKLLAAKLQYLGVAAVAPATLLTVSAALGLPGARSRRLVAALSIVSLAMVVLVMTNEAHGWVWAGAHVTEARWGGLILDHGPAFDAFSLYSHGLLAATVALALHHIARGWPRHRRELLWLLAAIAPPWIGNLLYVGGWSEYDLSCVGFAATGLALAYGVTLDRGMLEIVRLARGDIVEMIQDAVLVADARGRLVYANPAARTLLGARWGGRPLPVEEALPRARTIASWLDGGAEPEGEVEILGTDGPLVLEVRTAPTGDPLGVGSRVLVLRDVTERRQNERRIRNLAYYDALTGLPKRERFHEILGRAIATGRLRNHGVALLFLDVDRFKRINDTWGHGEGDGLIEQVARRLERAVRFTDAVGHAGPDEQTSFLSRLGGDEFTILLSKISRPLDASLVARRILEAMEAPFSIAGGDVFVGASIGIAIHPEDGPDAETLLRSADTAMYHAKRRGGARFEFFAPSMNVDLQRRSRVESAIRRQLERGEAPLHYQPQRRIGTSRIEGVEALLRCWTPDGEAIPASEAVSVAEESGLIAELGRRVLEGACAQLRDWIDRGYREIRMAVNVSTHQLRDPGFGELLERTLRRHGLGPGCLEIEITESAVLEEDEATNASLAAAARLGVGLALDDFGTGFSSLSHLRRVAFDRLKIDCAFVAGLPTRPEDAALVRSLVHLAHELGMEVVGEGVETREQYDFLAEAGCDAAQGHLVGRSMAASELEPRLERKADPPPAA